MSRLYVGHIPYQARERDVERFFEGYGKIREILMKHGYCFVEFEDDRDADDACHELNGKSMMGMKVFVEMAKGRPRGGDRHLSQRDRSRSPRRSSRRSHSASPKRNSRRDSRSRSRSR